MNIRKLFLSLILTIVLCNICVFYATASADKITPENSISTSLRADLIVEIVSLFVSQSVVIITVIISGLMNKREIQKGVNEQRYLSNIQEINKIMIDMYDVYLETYDAVIQCKGDCAESIDKKIERIHIHVMSYCSNDAEKLVRYYNNKMKEMKKSVALGDQSVLKSYGSLWLLAYISVMRSVLKYEVTGNKTSPNNTLSISLEGIYDERLYLDAVSKANAIVIEAKISRKLLEKY